MIQTKNLTCRFGQLTAVDNLTLTVPRGVLFGFLGPKGAGKTTTIRLLTGLLQPTAGTAVVAGYDVQQQPMDAKRAVGYLAQSPLLFDQLTGLEFLRFMGGLYALEEALIARRSQQLLELLQMSDNAGELIAS